MRKPARIARRKTLFSNPKKTIRNVERIVKENPPNYSLPKTVSKDFQQAAVLLGKLQKKFGFDLRKLPDSRIRAKLDRAARFPGSERTLLLQSILADEGRLRNMLKLKKP